MVGGVPVLARRAVAFRQGGALYAPEGIEWFTIGSLKLEIGMLVDGLTAIMLVVVTSVSLCVHVYSLGYMDGEQPVHLVLRGAVAVHRRHAHGGHLQQPDPAARGLGDQRVSAPTC
jgi:formate hydrogenlyase subunit 3/multisubunit Na+/H+ antiporter MnhD subunit